MALNPPGQYADDRNLRARQRLWELQQPPFDIVGWVLEVAGVAGGESAAPGGGPLVLDAGCGNGVYLRELRRRAVAAIGCDLSLGMLWAAAAHPALVNGDLARLPMCDRAFGVVLAPHMLYHVPERETAVAELRRVLRPGGTCVVVTNGAGHLRALRDLVEGAVAETTPGWEMRNPSTHAFSLENGETQLRTAFASVTCVRPAGVAPVRVTDASVAADYVASVADHYQPSTARPWREVVEAVRDAVRRTIDAEGAFIVAGDTGAFVCR